MTGHASEVRDALVGWADRQVDRAMSLAASRSRLAGVDVPGPDAAFLGDLLEQRRRRHQDLALDALAILHVPEASGVIRRCLRSNDADVRAQAVETLDLSATDDWGDPSPGSLNSTRPQRLPISVTTCSSPCVMMTTRGSGLWRHGAWVTER